ncbi:lysophospholipid acyltransferase family protein [Paracoccus aerodenitrificans]|uniref:lysophospholipid acyltransferase family protein n=1 Tax=Paracoccus aerodenitrificans TaxID=3017781 RepID=UPI0022F0444C|nr:lysophospholipid acyltransferase family protein [Paracoccus aerodenitrificans]WBU65359.1 lysophospholipid acyltransferase family protein [Paracoccus aerodenitrificans]
MAETGLSGPTWAGGAPPVMPRPGFRGWLRILRRGLPAIAVLILGVPLLILLRFFERIFSGPCRPVTGPFVQGVCRCVLFCIGLRWTRHGRPMQGPGAVVANHSSWLDIFTLNAAMPVFFVAKSEVSSWPGINILTRVTDTHFVARDRRLAAGQAQEFASRTRAGHRLLFFPEGTSSDGMQVLPFKPTLFQGFLAPELPQDLAIQPVTAIYHAPEKKDPRFYGWWGDMPLGPHILAVLSVAQQGHVEILLHEPIPVSGKDRKTLSRLAETAIRDAMPARRG